MENNSLNKNPTNTIGFELGNENKNYKKRVTNNESELNLNILNSNDINSNGTLENPNNDILNYLNKKQPRNSKTITDCPHSDKKHYAKVFYFSNYY